MIYLLFFLMLIQFCITFIFAFFLFQTVQAVNDLGV